MKVSEWLLDLLFTPRCVFCRQLLRAGQRPRVCPSCNRIFPRHYLTLFQQVDDEEKVNGRALFAYEGIVRAMLLRFKYEGQKTYAEELALWMMRRHGDWFKALKPDALLYVPLHKKRYKKRGYNQALALASELGKLTGVPVLTAAKRVVNTRPQMSLGRALRLINMKGSMQRTKEYQKFLDTHPGPLTFVIVDDIYTTGSTVETVAEALREPRATFCFWAAARSHPEEDPSGDSEENDFRR